MGGGDCTCFRVYTSNSSICLVVAYLTTFITGYSLFQLFHLLVMVIAPLLNVMLCFPYYFLCPLYFYIFLLAALMFITQVKGFLETIFYLHKVE